MDTIETQNIQRNLAEKRQNLAEWLETASTEEKSLYLGPARVEQVREHIHVIDEALEKASKGELGICTICGEPVDEELLEMDYTAHVCLSHLTPEEAEPLERELELSRMIQQSLLPQEAPQFPGLDLAVFLRPAQIVGGDFFDFQRFQDGKFAILIADVVGKGMSASLIMASMQMALRALIPESSSPSMVLSRINSLFSHNMHFTMFVTMVLGAYDAEAKTLTYVNAGHNPPLIYRRWPERDGELLRLDPTGAALGLLEDPPFREKTISLMSGDMLFFYTDGIPEAFDGNGAQFGMERVEDLLRRHAASRPRALIRDLQAELQAFVGEHPPSDDITMIAGRVDGQE